ncbi:MAG: DNA polymerase II large subunit [Candidatus Parvarchaeota archaeon]
MVRDRYTESISAEVSREYSIAQGLVQASIPIAKDTASKVEGLLSVIIPDIIGSGLAGFIRENEAKYGPNDWHVAINAAIAVADSKFVKFKDEKDAIEAGIRVGLAYMTLGVVSAPLEGFIRMELKKRYDGKDYISCFFGGPIRGAGGTAAASVIVIADALRAHFGIGKYDPTEEEVGRVKIESSDYNEYEARLQYLPTVNELDVLWRNLPVELDGDPTTDREISAYKNIARIKTNRIRGGAMLVLCEGLASKAQKINKVIKAIGDEYNISQDFSFLDKYIILKEKEHTEENGNKGPVKVLPNYRYLEELAAGRPVFSYPQASGGFRLRYGRARTSGLAACALNPVTCRVLDNFVATGSQMRVELPGKACAVTPNSMIDGPVVKLKSGAVVKLNALEQFESLKEEVVSILYLGDILFNFGDFLEQNHLLMPSPFVEEWWSEIVSSKGEKAVADSKSLKSFEDHLHFSKTYQVPLHPKYVDFWSQITLAELKDMIRFIYSEGKTGLQMRISGVPSQILSIPLDENIKRTLEKLGTAHTVVEGKILIEDADSIIFLTGLNRLTLDEAVSIVDKADSVLSALTEISGVEVKDTAGTFIGARLGRPEKAKMREMETNPNVIFPVGESGGRDRNIVTAYNKGEIYAEFGMFFCRNCNRDTIYSSCEICGSKTEELRICRVCGQKTREAVHHGMETKGKTFRRLDIKYYLDQAYSRLGISERMDVIKGVKGVFNSSGYIEPLEKGILRAIYGLNVNKDGTVRFDAIELPITHFKPKEIETSVEKLRDLGYTEDIYGEKLTSPDQIVQLFPQDIILPTYGDGDENAAEVFIRISNFIDDLMERYFKAGRFYNIKSKEDLVGHLVIGLAPHTSAGIVGRIIGFSKTQGLFASPFFHAAMRRNCDGDEAALILLMDALLNFDRRLLPDTRGAKYMDSPLVISDMLDLNGIDSEAYNVDIVDRYPLEFYEATLRYEKPSNVRIKTVKDILNSDTKRILFTKDTDDINNGVNVSAYKVLDTMSSKVGGQMFLEEKIRAVDASDVARIIIEKHFIKDIKGNLRRFGTQEFRCVRCNQTYSRPPLSGRCTKCGGNLVLTSSEGNIKKYLYLSLKLAEDYSVPDTVKQKLQILKSEIDSIFGESRQKQLTLDAI